MKYLLYTLENQQSIYTAIEIKIRENIYERIENRGWYVRNKMYNLIFIFYLNYGFDIKLLN